MYDIQSCASSTISYRNSFCFVNKALCKFILFFELVGALHRLVILTARKSRVLFYRRFVYTPLESIIPNKYMLCVFCMNKEKWQLKRNILDIHALFNVPDHFKQVVVHHDSLYRVIFSVPDPRKCEYLKDYSLDFEHAYMTTYLAS